MSFELRLLDTAKYRNLTAGLDRVAAGDRAALKKLTDLSRAYLESEAFHHWNHYFDSLKSRWLEVFAAAEQGPVSLDQWDALVDYLVAAVAMPEFQRSTLAADGPSPNLVVLGNEDGGLYGVLRNMSRWFDQLLLERLTSSCVRYPYGPSMVLFDRETVTKLHDLLGQVDIPPDPAPGFSETMVRLKDLCARCLASQDFVIALSSTPP